MTDTVIGYKLLEGDHSLTSTYGVVTYPADGEWHEVPGHGAYVAVSGGLYSAGGTSGDQQLVLVELECRDEVRDVSPKPPEGVRCFRRVRRSRTLLDYARVAKNDGDPVVREAAVGRVIDQAVLADVAKTDVACVRYAAVARVTDQAVLADVAKNDVAWDVRRAAVERITDPAVLADVAKTSTHRYVRKVAVRRVTDQSVLADVAKNDTDWGVRCAAVRRVTDPALLRRLAKTDVDWDVRCAAVERVKQLQEKP
jgi:hypothetical protein